jgi:hypothetical protein
MSKQTFHAIADIWTKTPQPHDQQLHTWLENGDKQGGKPSQTLCGITGFPAAFSTGDYADTFRKPPSVMNPVPFCPECQAKE